MSQNFEIENTVFTKRPVDEIIADSKTIDAQKIANEVLNWTIANVENFIDNQVKMFKLDLILDNAAGTEETKRLQDLYRAIDDDNEKDLDKAEKCRRLLDEITAKAFSHIKESKEQLRELFNRMIFYYERIIPNSENKKRALAIDSELRSLFMQKEKATEEEKVKIQERIVEIIKEGEKLVKFTEFEGSASITEFVYDAFNVGVQIKKASKDPKQDIKTCSVKETKEVVKEYNIPEGFALWIEINFGHKQRPTNMF